MIKDKEINFSVSESDFTKIVDTGVCQINDNITVYLTQSQIENLSWGEKVRFVESGFTINLALQDLGKEKIFQILKRATYKTNLINTAQDTLNIIKIKEFNGQDISKLLDDMTYKTEYFEDYSKFYQKDIKFGPVYHLDVLQGTTIEAIQRLHRKKKEKICVLNFASAKKPGGGFINGAIAQEESLARSSGLYQSLVQFPEFYAGNQAPFYSDKMIYSPNVPFFKDDKGMNLSEPILASVITCAAPNLTGLSGDEFAVYVGWKRDANIEKKLHSELRDTFIHRIYNILKLARDKREENIVLGAWGCGVFKNDPKLVSQYFKDVIASDFMGRFESIEFAIYDPTGNIIKAFSI